MNISINILCPRHILVTIHKNVSGIKSLSLKKESSCKKSLLKYLGSQNVVCFIVFLAPLDLLDHLDLTRSQQLTW